MPDETIYRISFYNQGDIYELYAHDINEGNMYAFLEVDGIIFDERSSVVVDPSEERLKTEFEGVSRTYIPLQAVIRIDEVERQGSARIIPGTEQQDKIMPFPGSRTGQRHRPE